MEASSTRQLYEVPDTDSNETDAIDFVYIRVHTSMPYFVHLKELETFFGT